MSRKCLFWFNVALVNLPVCGPENASENSEKKTYLRWYNNTFICYNCFWSPCIHKSIYPSPGYFPNCEDAIIQSRSLNIFPSARVWGIWIRITNDKFCNNKCWQHKKAVAQWSSWFKTRPEKKQSVGQAWGWRDEVASSRDKSGDESGAKDWDCFVFSSAPAVQAFC